MSVVATVFLSVLIASGLVYAATTRNITSKLGGIANDQFDLSGTIKVNALRVNNTSYLGGPIVNPTLTKGVDNPITFGDNVRFDGRVWRGATAGPGDNKPFIINDDTQITGNITAANATLNNLSTTSLTVNGAAVGTKKTYEGTIDLTGNGDDIVSIAALNPNCDMVPMAIKYTKYHYKKIAIPEITASALPNLRAYCHAHPTSTLSTMLPNSHDVWTGCNLYYAEGYGYLLYKYENETCAGSIISTTYYMDGQYKFVIYQ